MSGDASPARPAPRDSDGAYLRSSGTQAAGLLAAVELLEHSAHAVELPHRPQPVYIADYGASAGHNSLLPIGAAITKLRSRIEPGQAIWVVHTDVAENDYRALFDALASDPNSYLQEYPATYPCVVGRSLYGQILPSSSVTLGWSSWSLQWLSRVPAPIPDHVQIAGSQDKAARAAYAKQAADDWLAFLTARSREMSPGGHLVVLTMGLDGDDFGYRPLLSALMEELDAVVGDGVVSDAEVRRMVIPTVGRSEHELTAPFAPKMKFSRLAIEHLEIFDAGDRIWKNYQTSGDAKAYGAAWTAFARASVFPTLTTALDGGPRTARAAQFLERLESGFRARIAANPEKMKIPLAKLVLVKDSWPR